MRIGITGHRDLTPSTAEAVDAALRETLTEYGSPDLTGVSCLAEGADQLFAEAVLDAGGRLECVVLAAEDCGAHLRAQADEVKVLPYTVATPQAYMAASCAILDRIERLIAVWDGEAAAGYGGTADVVNEALRRGLPVIFVWPPNSERTSRRVAEPATA